MPIVAVALAIGVDAIAASAVIGTVGGITAISTATAFGVVAAVGATIGAIGAVTRDKTLSMVGLGIGAIGGIGALATSAGLFGAEAASGAPLFGSATEGTQAAAGTFGGDFIPQISAPGSAAASGGVEAGAWTVADAASDGTIPFLAGNAAAPIAETTTAPSELTTLNTTSESVADPARALAQLNEAAPLLNAEQAGSGQAQLDQAIAGGSLQSGAPPPPPNSLGTTSPVTGEVITSNVDPITGKIVSLPEADKGFFGNILSFAQKNPIVALGALQAAGSFLNGATNQLTPAQIAAYNANAANNQAQADLTNQQRANLAMPKAIASTTPVTGAPQPLVPQMPGLINQPPKLAPVTGAPA